MILNGLPWKWTEIILSFLRLHSSTAFQTLLLTYESYSISSKGFLPTWLDIIFNWIKFTHSGPFKFTDSQNIHVHSCHLLLTTSSFTWFMDHSKFLPNVVLCSIEFYFHHQSHPQLGIVFLLVQPFHSFWSYFSTLSSSILGLYTPGEFIFQCHIFLPYGTTVIAESNKGIKEPIDESKRGEWTRWLKTQHSKN